MNKGERNYHSFYHLAAAAPPDERKRLGLEKGPDGFNYLHPGNAHTIESMPDGEFYNMLSSCLKTCGLSEEVLREVYSVVAAVLHVGNR